MIPYTAKWGDISFSVDTFVTTLDDAWEICHVRKMTQHAAGFSQGRGCHFCKQDLVALKGTAGNPGSECVGSDKQ